MSKFCIIINKKIKSMGKGKGKVYAGKGQGKCKGGKGKGAESVNQKKARSRSFRSGLQFPVGRLHRYLKVRTNT